MNILGVIKKMKFAIPYIYYYFCVFFGIFSSQTSKELKQITKLFFICLTVYFIGLRGFIEADWLVYYPVWELSPTLFDSFDDISTFLTTTFYEKGFAFFLILCKTILNDYLFVQFVVSIFTIICLDKFFSQYCKKYYYLAFCVFYLFGGYILSIILIRNCISVMIFLLSVPSLVDRNWKKYFFLNLLGCLFHTSSVFYFPLYFLLVFSFPSSFIFTLWIIGNGIFLLQIPLATHFFTAIGDKLLGKTGSLIVSYLNSKQYSVSYGISIGYLERSFTFLFFFLNRKKINEKEDKIFLNMFYLYSFIFLYCSDFRIVVDRIPTLIYCCYWVLYPKLYKFFCKKTKMLFLTLLLLYSIMKIYMFFGTPIGYYENIITGAMSYQERKNFTLKETTF